MRLGPESIKGVSPLGTFAIFFRFNKMRLSVQEYKAVCDLLKSVDPNGQLYLFGSRTDNTKKGGDIDLFFEASKILDLKQRLTLEYLLSVACDTKVDLIVKNPDQEEQPIFMIARKGILL